MFKRKLMIALSASALAAGIAACGSSSSSSGGGTTANAANTTRSKLPTVTMMVGGIDKQIYLPYQLAQNLGFYKKYGVNMQLSTEQNGGVGAEDAMASGQVDMAGAWYVHTIDFQEKGKDVISVAQLSGAPGEREMCAKGTTITSPVQWKGKTVGVTDIGSGTDELTQYMAHRGGLNTQQYSRAAVGAGPTFVAALQHQRIACGMTSQPTAGAVQSKGIGYTAINLATTSGAEQALGGAYPAAGVLAQASWVNSHQKEVQAVVDALVATMHWIATHSAAQIADAMPPGFVSNGLTTKADYVSELAGDKGQFLPDGMMPANGPQTVYTIEKFIGNAPHPINIANTYTNSYVIAANKLEGYTK
ncbi:MAG TPA: ABC transporter substrate-binding protein [Solirubrobacteraceae bacterium]|nr:ABC transporter substrate-binding protein [Solirubrobacteraceae bacterium]